jgi:hypothetical protein
LLADGVAGAVLIGVSIEFEEGHPPAVIMFTVSPTLPDAPAE